MHYYKRNIGDYAKKAGRLSMLEHGSYTLLIDSCYDREQFPTLQQAIDWCWARSDAEIEAVKFVLSKFFTLDGEVYVQNRIQEELADYHQKAIKNKEIATERESKRKEKARIVHASSPNHEPITNNHKQETINNNKEALASSASHPVDKPDSVSPQVWADFIALRKKKSAPLTETAWQQIQKEAGKAGWSIEDALKESCARGWQGFKADWVAKDAKPVSNAFAGAI